jgi:DNA-binding XRE family transcriptional regulator
MDFPKAVVVMRAFREMTQEELATAIGVSRATIWQIERGFTPPAEMQDRIREVLHWGPREDEALNVLAESAQ